MGVAGDVVRKYNEVEPVQGKETIKEIRFV